ncbi:MAG: hypothetical protein HOI95_18680 [Chromatiales bacterium]|jgi:carnitine 3-dehydrogenase|nr:hypothetical protein [Chromatiales bacterium]
MPSVGTAAVIGGGVIGGGWVARLSHNGIDVNVFDPDPDAARKLAGILAIAEQAQAKLITAPRPSPGRIYHCATLAEAVAPAQFIQESAPERLDIKRAIHKNIDAHASPDALIGSSTSGLLPTDIQADMGRPERMFVAHPYNPVYLLPLVELVAGKATAPETIERARALFQQLGMKPVVIRKEIDAFVGDRLLESVWREALWLLKDDVATVEEIDDIIRYSFGLRWAQMGLFMTYRLGGGEAGMRHFLEQFAPSLHWPWTHLMDVPDLDDALINKIADQSDAQAAGLSIQALQTIRDDNLVRIMQALQEHDGGNGWGAGQTLRKYQKALLAKQNHGPEPPGDTN